jgi:hypothetical protein
MSSRQSFSLGKALSAAVTGVPAAWGGAGLGLVLLLAAFAAWPLAFAHLSCCVALAGGVVVLWLLKLMALGGLYRTHIFGRTAGAEGRGPGGLQFGAAEVRLLFSTLVIALFVAMIVLAGFLVFAIAFDLSGLARGYSNSFAGWHAAVMRHHSVTDWVFTVLPLIMVLFFVFVSLKVVLAPVATVAERRMVTLNAMGLSAGNVGKLFVGLVALAAPFVVAGAFLPMHGEMMTHSHSVTAAHFHMHLMWHVLMAALAVGLLLPLQTGFLASAYRQIVDLRAK